MARQTMFSFHVLIKPIGPKCNLDCTYCFYLEKEELYPETRDFRMTEEVLEAHVRGYIESQPSSCQEINFAWQGGEPTMMGLPFFEKAVAFQEKYARPGMRITNALQTNATLLDDDWAQFLKAHDFLVGPSIDGPEALHDKYRIDKNGGPTFKEVMRGIEVLQKHNVTFNTLTVVHQGNCDHPQEVYDFLTGIGSEYLQFIPMVESREGKMMDPSVPPKKWGSFLNGILDAWIAADDFGKVYIQLFEMMVGVALGQPASLCVHAKYCGHNVAIEHNGDVYSCDHYVEPAYKLGNVLEDSYAKLMSRPVQSKFGRDKSKALPDVCKKCTYLRYCHGACPKDRDPGTAGGVEGLNFLCQGYYDFYDYSVPKFDAMAKAIKNRQPAMKFRDYLESPAS